MNRQLPRGGCRLLPVLLVAILVGCQGTPPPSASLPATPAATQREQARERAQVTEALLDDDTAGVCRMDHPGADRKNHWETVYRRKPADSVSWYRPHLDVSLELLSQGGMNGRSAVIDVGGGTSTLVDDLLDRGLRDVTVLDVSESALAVSQSRLGERAKLVQWRVGDVLRVPLPPARFDLWHDRAVLHFLTDPADALRYARIAAAALRVGGYAVIAGFAPDGPERCSGLPVARRSAEEIGAIFAPAFALVQQRTERHRTPAGAEQAFAYGLLQRR
jgi:SAM-dependent methyltransferase